VGLGFGGKKLGNGPEGEGIPEATKRVGRMGTKTLGRGVAAIIESKKKSKSY